MENNFDSIKSSTKETLGDPEYDKAARDLKGKITKLNQEIFELRTQESNIIHSDTEKIINESKEAIGELNRIERMLAEVCESIENENSKIIVGTAAKKAVQEPGLKNKLGSFLKEVYAAASKAKLRTVLYLTLLPATVATDSAIHSTNAQEYFEMFQNYKERHWDKRDQDDPNIKGIDDLYDDHVDVVRTTYDFLGKDKINYKSGYYMTSVFDLSDRTPPKFELINDREHHSKIDNAAGITTNLFKKFYKWSEFQPQLKGHLEHDEEKRGNIGVIGYNPETKEMKAGLYSEFDENWLVSETYKIPLNFKKNQDGTLNMVYHDQALRMVPESLNEGGVEIPFPVGVALKNKDIEGTFDPYKATNFGPLEGGKVIMVCGQKQLQVNGSFADMFRVYERLQKENPGKNIDAYLLDNGSYNLPIWSPTGEISEQMISEHLNRNKDGGTALVLINDGSISPFEYKNKYKEFQHIIPRALEENTGQPFINEDSAIVLHHTGNYYNPQQILNEFEDPANERSAHVVIFKDGTRHIFDDDKAVLAHAGKSIFHGREKVNLFSLGIELEGDSLNGHQFTVAQLESLIEYLRPRIEKYDIPFENITDHKTIRDNWLLAHPDRLDDKGKPVEAKRDLDDAVFQQILDLIKKKLYASERAAITGDTSKLTGAIAYQDAYRITGDKELSWARSEEMLREFKVPIPDINLTKDWIRNFS